MRARRKLLAPVVVTGLGATIAALAFSPLGSALRTHPAPPDSFAADVALFSRILGDVGGNEWIANAAERGLMATQSDGNWQGVLLHEQATDCAGRGAYLLRDDQSMPIAITAPHRGADRYTGSIAAALFLETGAAAAAWNSAPRRKNPSCAAAIDLAKAEDHPFTAFSLAFAQTFPTGLIFQLHGFDGNRRQSEAARNADIIISGGTREPITRLLDLADCLSRAMAPRQTLVYPFETGELGALTNAQGKVLREKAGFEGFVHLEMSANLRATLANDPTSRARLAACMREVAQ